jgi:uncharacterized protein YihD (DUF1040 family)
MADNLAQAFGKKFNKDTIRTRSFEMAGHTFRVRVPLTIEIEAMNERLKTADEEKVIKYYNQLTESLIKLKEEAPKDSKIEYKEDDVIIEGRSMREAATNKALTELRITEMFKLLVPEIDDFDMNTITYDMVEELFPFAIQIQVMEEIAKTISPEYSSIRGKSSGQSEGK